ncbi:hypothetical protein Tco_0014876 [Tanacetum coccineum]
MGSTLNTLEWIDRRVMGCIKIDMGYQKLYDVRATNIVLQGLPKDIYKLINHNIEAKAIWDNVKMLLAGSELIKEDRESQLYDEFERFKVLPGENINEYYVRFHKLVNDIRNIRMTMPNIQLDSKFVNSMSPKWDRFVTAVKLNKGLKEINHEQVYAYLKQHKKHAAQDRLIIERITHAMNDQLAFVSTGNGTAGNRGVQNRAGNANAGQDTAEHVAPKPATKKPQPAPTKPKEKKRKQVKETTEATPPAKRAKAGKVAKKQTLKRSQQLVDEFVDEGIPLTEPGFGDLEADTQRAIKESLKDAHSAHQGLLLPVVIRETDTEKYQPLPEVEGKGKEKVAPTEPSGHDESSSLYAELGLTKSDTESDKEEPPIVKSGTPDKGQAGPNPGIQDDGQAGPNPGNDTVSQTLSTPGVHAGPNLEHTDAEATDATMIPEEPASSTGTLSSLQHLAKDFSFGD